MNLDDTIVAIATPAGRGGIGVVRLAGAEARAIAVPMLRLKREMEPGCAIFGELVEPDSEPGSERDIRIDEVVVTYFAKPHSYTTDDIVEISAHGSPVVLRHIVELCLARGARLAEPGEFTMRAFLNGRLDLTQAEAVRDLIDSQTLFQAKVAARQLGGALSHRISPIKRSLVELIALLEAGIDFAEDDVSVAADAVILQRIANIKEPLRERAIVTAQPGTTRDLVSETVAIGGIPVELVDTAGIRLARDEAESMGIRKSMEALAEADLVLVVVDQTQDLTREDTELLSQVGGRPLIVVANKVDLMGEGLRAAARELLSERESISTSALTGEGIGELREAILRHVGGELAVQAEGGLLTSVRHRKLVDGALAALDGAENAVAGRVPHEMLLLDLYGALRPLDEITGATTTDDILNLIFGTFCIGK